MEIEPSTLFATYANREVAATTVSTVEALSVPEVAVIVEVPTAKPMAMPLVALMEAVAGVPELHERVLSG
jgi:hypothetical protein